MICARYAPVEQHRAFGERQLRCTVGGASQLFVEDRAHRHTRLAVPGCGVQLHGLVVGGSVLWHLLDVLDLFLCQGAATHTTRATQQVRQPNAAIRTGSGGWWWRTVREQAVNMVASWCSTPKHIDTEATNRALKCGSLRLNVHDGARCRHGVVVQAEFGGVEVAVRPHAHVVDRLRELDGRQFGGGRSRAKQPYLAQSIAVSGGVCASNKKICCFAV